MSTDLPEWRKHQLLKLERLLQREEELAHIAHMNIIDGLAALLDINQKRNEELLELRIHIKDLERRVDLLERKGDV